MFKYLSNLFKENNRKQKTLETIYRVIKNMEINQIKKGLIDYILDDIYDLNYCREIFLCNDKFELIRYIYPLWKIKKSKYNYNKYFDEFPLKSCYFTLLFDMDTQEERIIKTKSHIILNRIKSLCYYYSLKYGFDVYSLYEFMDNNKYKEMNSDDDYSFDEEEQDNYFKKITNFNDNLRVIITPIFPQRKKKLIKGDYINIDKYKDKLTLPMHSYVFPKRYMQKELNQKDINYFNKLQFPINIDEKIDENIFLDNHTNNVVIMHLSVEDIYRFLYLDNILYKLGLTHYNGYCLSSPNDNYLLFDSNILNDKLLNEKRPKIYENINETTQEEINLNEINKLKIIDEVCQTQNNLPIRKYTLGINKFNEKDLLNYLEIKFIENKLN